MSRSRGFTLVEVLTVIAFIGIMTGVVFVSMSGKRDDAALTVSAREVAAAIRAAQSNALSGVKDPGNGNGLCFHHAKATGSNAYALYIVHLKNNGTNCQTPNNTDFNNNPYEESSFSLSNGVTFQNSSWKVSFDVPRGNFDANATYSDASPVPIVLQKGSRYSAVCVASSGAIVEKPVSSSVPSCS